MIKELALVHTTVNYCFSQLECVCKQTEADWLMFRGGCVRGQHLCNVFMKTWRAARSMRAVIRTGLCLTSAGCNDIMMPMGQKMNVCRDCDREERLLWVGKSDVIKDFSWESDALSALIFKWCLANAMVCF